MLQNSKETTEIIVKKPYGKLPYVIVICTFFSLIQTINIQLSQQQIVSLIGPQEQEVLSNDPQDGVKLIQIGLNQLSEVKKNGKNQGH